ncbi:MAG: Redoxin domain protein [Nocardioides sp.]|nr:Redoxin domain protein [Nocardioides sp.]
MEGTGDKGYITGDGRIVQIPEAGRGEPVDLKGESLEGDPIDLADYRGDVVVVNMWWSGCGPCRAEMPMLATAAEETAGTADFVGINIRDSSQAQGLAFSRQAGVEYPSIWAPDGQALLAFSGRVSLSSVPSTAVLDSSGRVAAVISGDVPGKVSLVDLIQEVAAEDG